MRFNLKVIVGLIALAAVCTSGLIVQGYRQSLHQQETLLVNGTIRRLAVDLSLPIYNFQDSSIVNSLTANLSDPNLATIVVTDATGAILSALTRSASGIITPVAQVPAEPPIRESQIKSPLTDSMEILGSVRLWLAPDALKAERRGLQKSYGLLGSAFIVIFGCGLLLVRGWHQREQAEAKTLRVLTESASHLEQQIQFRTTELTQSERRFRTLFETMAQGVVIQDNAGIIISANPAAEKILGRTVTQMQGLDSLDPRWQIMDSHGQPLSGENHPSSLAQKTGQPVLGVTLSFFNPGNNAQCWILVDSIPQFLGDSSTPYQTVTSFNDITELIRTEELRAQQNLVLNFIVESEISGYWDWDPVLNTKFYSPSLKRMLGYDDHELANHPDTWQHLIHPEDLPRALEAIRHHISSRSRGPFYVEVRYLHKNGSIVWVICSGGVVSWLPDDKPARVVGSHINITESKNSEAKLVASNRLLTGAIAVAERLTVVATRTTNSVIITDARRHITWVNEGFTRTTGYTFEEVVGKSPGQLLQSSETDPATVAAMRSAFEQSQSFHGEIFNRGKDGRDHWLDIDIVPLHDATGALTGFVGIQLDITERKQAEIRLAAARDAALKANESKSTFLANMSHEIRTPMNGVIGMTHLLLDSDLKPEQRHYAQTIQSSGKALLELINNILDLSKIEAGRMEVFAKDFDLYALLNDCLNPLLPQAEAKGISLTLEKSADLPRLLHGDVNKLRQVLTNLAGNAVKFTEHGKVSLQITLDQPPAGHSPSATHYLRFAVKDTGQGISEDKIGLLFQKFSQVDASATRKHGGTGLGLAISKELVGLMGGTIGVDSQLGQCTTFWFSLPFKPAKPNLRAAPTADHPDETTILLDATVLLVEDNLINQQVARGILKKMGLRVDIVANGRSAIESLIAKDYDLVLMDIQMPIMDGLSATRAIRDPATGVRCPAIPIIALTAHALTGARDEGMAAGFTDYLTKPIAPALLAQVLHRWLPSHSKIPLLIAKPAIPVTTTAPINLADLRHRMMGDEILIQLVLHSFSEALESQLAAIRTALASGESPLVAIAAHSLKGSAANLSADFLRDACVTLEIAANENNSPAFPQLLESIEAAVLELRAAFPA